MATLYAKQRKLPRKRAGVPPSLFFCKCSFQKGCKPSILEVFILPGLRVIFMDVFITKRLAWILQRKQAIFARVPVEVFIAGGLAPQSRRADGKTVAEQDAAQG